MVGFFFFIPVRLEPCLIMSGLCFALAVVSDLHRLASFPEVCCLGGGGGGFAAAGFSGSGALVIGVGSWKVALLVMDIDELDVPTDDTSS